MQGVGGRGCEDRSTGASGGVDQGRAGVGVVDGGKGKERTSRAKEKRKRESESETDDASEGG